MQAAEPNVPAISRECKRATWVLYTCVSCLLMLSAREVSAQAVASAERGPALPLSARQTEKPKSTREGRAQALKIAASQLASADEIAIETALASVVSLGGRDSAELVVARVRRGLPPQLLEAAVGALVELREPLAVPVLLELTTHRRWQVRELAIDALAALNARTAQSALLYALDDPNAQVRESAARALGKVGDGRALSALLTAHERGVTSALVSLGSLGGAREAELLGKRAQTECTAVTPALVVMLGRTNLNVQTKLKAVSLAGQGADGASCVSGMFAALGDKLDPRLRATAEKARPTPVASRTGDLP